MTEAPKFLSLDDIKSLYQPSEEMVGRGDQMVPAKIYRNGEGLIAYVEPGFGKELGNPGTKGMENTSTNPPTQPRRRRSGAL